MTLISAVTAVTALVIALLFKDLYKIFFVDEERDAIVARTV